MESNQVWFDRFIQKIKKDYSFLTNELELLINDEEEKSACLLAVTSYSETEFYNYCTQKNISGTKTITLSCMAAEYYKTQLEEKKQKTQKLEKEMKLEQNEENKSNIKIDGPVHKDEIEKFENEEKRGTERLPINFNPGYQDRTLIVVDNSVIIFLIFRLKRMSTKQL